MQGKGPGGGAGPWSRTRCSLHTGACGSMFSPLKFQGKALCDTPEFDIGILTGYTHINRP